MSLPGAMPTMRIEGPVRTLCVVLGDQLDHESEHLRGLDREQDAVLMMEVDEESTHVPSSRQRTTMFLAAMRHFALELVDRVVRVRYIRLNDRGNTHSFEGEIARAVRDHRPDALRCLWPGEWRVMEKFDRVRAEVEEAGRGFEMLDDTHFLTSRERFEQWMRGRKSVVMEHFYREQRKRLNILVDEDGGPEGGAWNYDADNREAFKKAPSVRPPADFEPDAITREVMGLVEARFPDAPGRLEWFGWPVTRADAVRALRDFVDHRLADFGRYEDAMWAGEDTLYHSRLSGALNLKLLRPMECVEAALDAHADGRAPLGSVEGFVRQIIGWREFIRGVYWQQGPAYRERNGLGQTGKLPEFYWTGETEMRCVRECLRPVLGQGWGHHIPRLMVLGNLALSAGVAPAAINDWFLSMYVDAVDWVTTPNVVGMSQHADGGVVGTKPYVSSGQYIDRMSNYCKGCRFDVKQKSGEDACPFNVLYWDFLLRHEEPFGRNQRMAVVMKNLERMGAERRAELTREGQRIRGMLGVE